MKGPLHTMSWSALETRVGAELGVSGWVAVTQALIDRFAETTNDHYFLHLDAARAAATPFGRTIAHGMLTLSLVPAMGYEVCPFVEGARYPLNYGFNRVRFVAPVPVDSRLRSRFVLKQADKPAPGQCQLVYDVTVEIGGVAKPALVAEWLTRYVL